MGVRAPLVRVNLIGFARRPQRHARQINRPRSFLDGENTPQSLIAVRS
jgi:hypothetical protein